MSPNLPTPNSPTDKNTKLAEVKVQLAALKASLLARKERLQCEQEEQDRNRQEAQEHHEEADRMEAERRVEVDIAEQQEKAPPRLDMEAVRAGLTRSSRQGWKSPESDDDSVSSVATAIPCGDKPMVVIRGPVALDDSEVASSLGKRKERESGDGVSPILFRLCRFAEMSKWDYYSVGCTNCIKQGLRCMPSSGPGMSCIVCRTHKVHCDESEGPTSNRTARNKDAGTLLSSRARTQ